MSEGFWLSLGVHLAVVEHPSVVISLQAGLYAITGRIVTEMHLLSEVTPVPAVPPYVRGVINLRGRVIPVIDLRLRLGMKPVREDVDTLLELLRQRKADHLRWLGELKASVVETRSFTLALDPHACAFGRWYDTYEAPNVVVGSHMRKFDVPHQRIHALGAEVADLMHTNQADAALRLIARHETTTLAHLCNLFDTAEETIRESQREMLVVLSNGGRPVGVTCDAVVSVEHMVAGSSADIPMVTEGTPHLVRQTATTAKSSKLVMLVDEERLMNAVQTASGVH